MFLPLTTNMIKKLNKQYLDKITNLDEDESREFWDEHSAELEYHEFVYLTMHFVMGNLQSTPSHLGPIMDNHKDSCSVLKQLALEGILTSNGQQSIEDKQRSYLDFEFPIEKHEIEDAIKLMNTLYESGLNVFATISKYDKDGDDFEYDNEDSFDNDYEMFWNPIRNIIMFESPDLTINDTNAPTMKVEIPWELLRVTHPGTHIHPEDTHNGYHFVNRIIYPTNYLVRIRIFNKEWNMLQADQTLLTAVREMKINLQLTQFERNAISQIADLKHENEILKITHAAEMKDVLHQNEIIKLKLEFAEFRLESKQ